MALGFIKKVFTFGREKPAEEQVREEHPTPPEAASIEAAIEAESEPHSLDGELPAEMETAGGPSTDETEEPDAVAEDSAAILPGAEETSDLGLVPLSLLEAEAAAATGDVAKAPPGLPAIPPAGGEITDAPSPTPAGPGVEGGAALADGAPTDVGPADQTLAVGTPAGGIPADEVPAD